MLPWKNTMMTPGSAGIEGLRRGEQHGAVVVGLVLPQEPAARARMAEPAVVVDVEEGPGLARLLVVRDEAVVGEGRVLERGVVRRSRRRPRSRRRLSARRRRGGGAAQLAKHQRRAQAKAGRRRPQREMDPASTRSLTIRQAASKDLFQGALTKLSTRRRPRNRRERAAKRPVNGTLDAARAKTAARPVKNGENAFVAVWRLALAAFAARPRSAQDKGTLDPKPLPPLANPADPKLPAKQVFGRAMTPDRGARPARSAITGAAASPARRRCRSTASPGR